MPETSDVPQYVEETVAQIAALHTAHYREAAAAKRFVIFATAHFARPRALVLILAMPIRPELRPLYAQHWRELCCHVRFERAEGRCQRCGRPHLALLRCLPDGRWFDEQAATWRDRRGRLARWPDLYVGSCTTRELHKRRPSIVSFGAGGAWQQ